METSFTTDYQYGLLIEILWEQLDLGKANWLGMYSV